MNKVTMFQLCKCGLALIPVFFGIRLLHLDWGQILGLFLLMWGNNIGMMKYKEVYPDE